MKLLQKIIEASGNVEVESFNPIELYVVSYNDSELSDDYFKSFDEVESTIEKYKNVIKSINKIQYVPSDVQTVKFDREDYI